MLYILRNAVKNISLCLQSFRSGTAKFPVFSLSAKSKDQISRFPCDVKVTYWEKSFTRVPNNWLQVARTLDYLCKYYK